MIEDNPFMRSVMTVEEVGAFLRLKPSTIADLAVRGDIPSMKIGRARRYVRKDIEAFIERRSEQA